MTNTYLWCASVVTLTLVALTWHRTQRAKGWPWSTFLYCPWSRHSDLIIPWIHSARPQPYHHPGVENVTPYLPLYYLLSGSAFQPRLVAISRVTYLLLCYALVQMFGWHLLVVLFAYPAIFSDDRGSIDHIIGAGSLLSIALLFGGHPVYGAVALAFVVALKGYPAPFGLMWLLQGEWVGLGVLAAATAALVLLPAHSFKGGIRATYAGWRQSLAEFYSLGVLAERGPALSTCHYSIDVLNGFRAIRWWRNQDFDAAKFLRFYMPIVLLVAASLAWRAATAERLWVALMALGLIQVLLPNVANDYKLAALVPGIALWFESGAPNWIVWTCLLVLWVPKAFWFPNMKKTAASIACVVSPIAVVGLVIGVWI